MKMWNSCELVQPPIASEIHLLNSLNFGLLRETRSQLFLTIEFLNSQSPLEFELATLSRLYYKFRNQWRREKCLLNIKQLENSVNKFCSLHLEKCLDNLKELMPNHFSAKDENVYLPSKSLLSFTQLRLLGSIGLVQRTINICLAAWKNLRQQLSAGLFLSYMGIISASVARIWILCKSLLNHLTSLYKQLYIWSQELKIEDDTCLPSDIDAWLKEVVPTHEEDTRRIEQDLIESSCVAGKIAEAPTDDIGFIVDRKSFLASKGVNSQQLGEDDVSNETTMKGPSLGKSKMVGKVKRFLNIEPDVVSDLVETAVPVELSKSETTNLLHSLSSCSTTEELKLLIGNLNKLHAGKTFRGVKCCLKRLKMLKKSSHNLKKDDYRRKKDNAAILREGQEIVSEFLTLNSASKEIQIKKEKENNTENCDPECVPLKLKNKSVKKRKLKYFELPETDKLKKFIYTKLGKDVYLRNMEGRLVKRKGMFKCGKRKIKLGRKKLALILQILNDDTINRKSLSLQLSKLFNKSIKSSDQ